MLVSALAFSIMSAFVKAAGTRLPSQEIVLARALISLGLSWGALRYAGVPILGNDKKWLTIRGVFGFVGLSCVYYSLTHLPIAAASVIQYMHPVFTAVIAAAFLREKVGNVVGLSLAISFVGLLFVAQPTFVFGGGEPLDSFAVAVAVGGAFFSACAYVVVRKLSRTENPLVIVFYFPLVTVPLSMPVVIPEFVMPTGWEWPILLGVGVFTQIGQLALTQGMRHEPAARATALSYMQIVFATLWGLLFFGEVPDWATAVGALLILTAAVVNIRWGGRGAADEPGKN